MAASHGSAGTPRGPVTTSIASSPQWAGEEPSSYAKRTVTGHTSQCLDMTGNGTYLFDFGPVPASFNYPSARGLAFDWPLDPHFSMLPANRPARTVTQRGKRYFQIGFTVAGFSSPYSGYRAWIN